MPTKPKYRTCSERIEFARNQRKQANEFARDVWNILRNRRLCNAKFRREHPIGVYTVDFACLDLMLVVEVDGKDHFSEDGQRRDARRDAYLQSEGYEVLRIPGFRVTQDRSGVRAEIEQAIKERSESKP
jgi:very-short-patch-repair endonuclease